MNKRKIWLGLALGVISGLPGQAIAEEHVMELSPRWEYVADRVMGGVSTGRAEQTQIAGRSAIHLTGTVSLDNDGGFIQVAFDMQDDGRVFDASGWTGIAIDLRGNDQRYELRVRTDQLSRPWQSFRQAFHAPDRWITVRIPFADLIAHKTDATFDPARVRRIGILAIGREFEVDIAISGVRLYR